MRDWQARAACRDMPASMFFPDSPSPLVNKRLALEAKAVCDACPVKRDCFEASRNEHWGIWAGINKSPKQSMSSEIPAWQKPRTMTCEVCGRKWRWSPYAGAKPPKACSASCRNRLISEAQVRAHKLRSVG